MKEFPIIDSRGCAVIQRTIRRERERIESSRATDRRIFPDAPPLPPDSISARDRILAAMNRRGVSRLAVESFLRVQIDLYHENLKSAADPGMPEAARDLIFFQWALNEPESED